MGKIMTTAAPAAFGGVAAGYDAEFEPYASGLRAVMQEAMLRVFRPGDHVLEINCGTGTDALALAGRGIRVTATDGSPEMIEALKRKLHGLPAAGAVDARVVPFADLGRLPAGSFDGAFSNFGGLNCADDLRAALRDLARALKPGAPLVACLLNRTCLWEMASFAARFDFRNAARRLSRRPVPARIGSRDIAVTYYSAKSFRDAAAPFFQVTHVFGLSILSPPPSSHRFIARHPRLVRRLAALDGAICRIPPFRSLGDHVAVIGRRP